MADENPQADPRRVIITVTAEKDDLPLNREGQQFSWEIKTEGFLPEGDEGVLGYLAALAIAEKAVSALLDEHQAGIAGDDAIIAAEESDAVDLRTSC